MEFCDGLRFGKEKEGEGMNHCSTCRICLDDLCGNCKSKKSKRLLELEGLPEAYIGLKFSKNFMGHHHRRKRDKHAD